MSRQLSTVAVVALAVVLILGCTGPAPTTQEGQPPPRNQPQATKALTLGVTRAIPAMGIAADSTTVGGWHTVPEFYAHGLTTVETLGGPPVGRLAAKVPSVEDGTIALLPDGGMRVTWLLRRDVTWHDGTPFTSQDLVFSYEMLEDPNLPAFSRARTREMTSVEAPDDYTFIMNFRAPAYWASSFEIREFWPHPKHVLEPAFQAYRSNGDTQAFLNSPYFRNEWVHVGPFRLTRFDPGEGLEFRAYDGYFLGRPQVDIIQVRIFGDPTVLFSNLLAGSTDFTAVWGLGSNVGIGEELRSRWEVDGGGTVVMRRGGVWGLLHQARAEYQSEPANLDPKVRAALYYGIDRGTLTEVVAGGRPGEFVANAVLPEDDDYFEATKDGLVQYKHDAARSMALLAEAGWTRGTDGALRHSSDRRQFATEVWSTQGKEVAIVADDWRKLGIDAVEKALVGAQASDREARSKYPGWEATTASALSRIVCPCASAANRWSGNRQGYEDPRAAQVVDTFTRSLSRPEALRAMRAISDFIATELPYLALYYEATPLAQRKGVRVINGRGEGYTTAHLWNVD